MARCEDFPCCGHESGCCPDYDESGRQLNMVCTCGAKLHVSNRNSICNSCLGRWYEDEDNYEDDYEDEDDYDGPDEAQEWYDFDPDC
jgi:hypothetical protein